jgi:SAM-dependent methyltransferase
MLKYQKLLKVAIAKKFQDLCMKEDFPVQVPPEQYYREYDHLPRFICYFHQIELVKSLSPKTVLEIGIGNKTVSNYLRQHGYALTTVDFDSKLEPDCVADIRALPFEDNSFDVVLTSEVLEHLPWQDVDKALIELHRVSKKYVVISVPYCSTCAEFTVRLPTFLQKFFGRHYLDLLIALPHFFKTFKFNGEHYWELGTKSRSMRKFKKLLETRFKIIRKLRPIFVPADRFLVLEKK